MLFQYYTSENKKFIFQKWNIITFFGILVLVPLMVLSIASYTGESGSLISKSKLIQGFYLGQTGYIVLTALYFGNEYQKSALRTSLLSTPNRSLFLFSKLLCILTWSILLLFITTITSVTLIKISLPNSLSVQELIKALIPAYISTIELVIITSGIVLLTKSMIVSMALLVSLILGLGNILLQYSDKMKYLPVISTMNGFFVSDIPIYLTVNKGMIVQAIWSLFLSAAALTVFNKRYVR